MFYIVIVTTAHERLHAGFSNTADSALRRILKEQSKANQTVKACIVHKSNALVTLWVLSPRAIYIKGEDGYSYKITQHELMKRLKEKGG